MVHLWESVYQATPWVHGTHPPFLPSFFLPVLAWIAHLTPFWILPVLGWNGHFHSNHRSKIGGFSIGATCEAQPSRAVFLSLNLCMSHQCRVQNVAESWISLINQLIILLRGDYLGIAYYDKVEINGKWNFYFCEKMLYGLFFTNSKKF